MTKKYRMYILSSKSDPEYIKVGKTNNVHRVPHLSRMNYGNKQDWEEIHSLHTSNDVEAYALESMVSSKLTKLGYKLPKVYWNDTWDKKRIESGKLIGATELFRAPIEVVKSVANEAEKVFLSFIDEANNPFYFGKKCTDDPFEHLGKSHATEMAV